MEQDQARVTGSRPLDEPRPSTLELTKAIALAMGQEVEEFPAESDPESGGWSICNYGHDHVASECDRVLFTNVRRYERNGHQYARGWSVPDYATSLDALSADPERILREAGFWLRVETFWVEPGSASNPAVATWHTPVGARPTESWSGESDDTEAEARARACLPALIALTALGESK